MNLNPPKITVTQSPDYRTINFSGVVGGARVGHIEALIFTEESDATEILSSPILQEQLLNIKRTLQCRLIIEPLAAKVLHTWLGNELELYEKMFGKIGVTPPKPEPDRTVT